MIRNMMTNNISANQADVAALVLRLVGGGFMLTHGLPKLNKLLAGDFGFADPIGIGASASLVLTVLAEFGGALLILIGLGTRIVSLPLMFIMLVAAFIVHGADSFSKKEFALLYFAIYLALFFLGSGKYSVDQMIAKRS